MKKRAVIDVGSNSIKFYMPEYDQDGSLLKVMDQNSISRLGEGLKETGFLSEEAMARNCKVISEFKEVAKQEGAEEIIAVGTMVLRTAKNAQEFIQRTKDSSGIEIKIITGEEEARLSYLAVLSGLDFQTEELVVFDTGGGSTEIIFGSGQEIEQKFSLNIGAIRITEEHLTSDPVTEEELDKALEEIRAYLSQGSVGGEVSQLVGMGGTVTSIGAVKHKMETYDPNVIQGSMLRLEEIDEQISMYSSNTIEERRRIVGLQPKRADVILAGACIVKVIMELLNVSSLIISDWGLRHGVIYDLSKESLT